jgi:hypothetical protein
MAANSSVALVNLDFDGLKGSLITFLQAQPIFQDYDFAGSNINVLLDLLTENSYLGAFLLNMSNSEAFLDSAQLRDSLVSKSKELNYIPESFRSAQATVQLSIRAANGVSSLIVPKGYSFSSRVGSNSFNFTTEEAITITSSNNTFLSSNVNIYEGSYVTDSFISNHAANTRYLLSNQTIDVSSISVSVIEDTGANTLAYSEAPSLFGLTANSQIYFVQGAENNLYEIQFGDGVIGRRPKDGSTVTIEYRISNGELPNGAFLFVPNGLIGGQANIAVSTVLSASGGRISEDLESIRFNAPRHFATQERMIVPDDYETLLKQNFPEIISVSAYGGEDANPPQYGKMIICVNISDFSGLPDSKKNQYLTFIDSRNTNTIKPVLTTPDFTYIGIDAAVTYNANSASLTVSDISSLVKAAIQSYSNTEINDFKSNFHESNLSAAIKDSYSDIIATDTSFYLVKKLNPTPGSIQNISFSFGNPLQPYGEETRATYPTSIIRCITSNQFIFNGQSVALQDNGMGIVSIVKQNGSNYNIIIPVGTVDYTTGNVTLNNFLIDSYFGDSVRIYAKTLKKDVFCDRNNILSILADETTVSVS